MSPPRFIAFVRSYFALLVVVATFAWSIAAIALYRGAQAPRDAIVLRLGHWQLEPAVREALDAMAKAYREEVNPRVHILQDAIPESVYAQWVTTQLMGGTAPDMMQVGALLPDAIWLTYYNRYFVPLTRFVNEPNPHNRGTDLEGVPMRQTYKDGMKVSYVSEMQEYIRVPLSLFGVRIFYNRDLLKKLTGRDAAPAEYRDFLKVCDEIAAARNGRGQPYIPIAGSAYHLAMAWNPMMFDPVTYPAVRRVDFNRDGFAGDDELFVGFKTGRIDFGFPAFQAKFRMIREVTDRFQAGYTGLSRDEAVFLFAQQRAVFIASGTWDARSLEEQAEGQFAVGVMDFPLPAEDDPVYGGVIEGPLYENPGAGFAFGITRTSAHPDIALDFLRFIASKKNNEELNRIIGWIPAIKGTQVDPLLKAFEPHLEGIYGAMPITLGGETIVKWEQLFSLFQIGQIDYDELSRRYSDAYLKDGLKDFEERQRVWRRAMHSSEQFLAGIRARALSTEGEEQVSNWVKYRAITAQRQVWAEIDHARQVKLMREGAGLQPVGPYEYSPAVLARVRARLSAAKTSGTAN
jgi:ABC-type glycerol-3-phosphate transport system substrate-binding protein